MIAIHCVDQEYWAIKKQFCSCGGKYRIVGQALSQDGSTPVDTVYTECQLCGSPSSFKFDISAFHTQDWDARAEIQKCLELHLTHREIFQIMSPPMETTLMYIRRLAEANDDLALEYIADAIKHAQREG